MHTKGPWKAVQMGSEGWSVFMPHEHNGVSLERVVASNHSEANARLIAAAPELLDACELAFANLKPQGDIQKDFDGHVTMAAIGKAVHKAKGE